uniref:Uncharacterized protein n=1 Tax=Spironucleus salmonicida TaxID=348837 RepID=V6LD17_9EUKA|eukprot:EST42352.1 Hypothetical protein SS50377_18078 [Spironucleus salmonicida]
MQLRACNVFRQLLSQIDCESQYNREYLYSYNNVFTIIQAFSNILTQIKRAEYANIANMSLWDHMIFVQKVKSKNNTIGIATALETPQFANQQILNDIHTDTNNIVSTYRQPVQPASHAIISSQLRLKLFQGLLSVLQRGFISDDVCTSWIHNFIHSGTYRKPCQLGNQDIYQYQCSQNFTLCEVENSDRCQNDTVSPDNERHVC